MKTLFLYVKCLDVLSIKWYLWFQVIEERLHRMEKEKPAVVLLRPLIVVSTNIPEFLHDIKQKNVFWGLPSSHWEYITHGGFFIRSFSVGRSNFRPTTCCEWLGGSISPLPNGAAQEKNTQWNVLKNFLNLKSRLISELNIKCKRRQLLTNNSGKT